MCIQQTILFSFNELIKYEPTSFLENLFSQIDITPAIVELKKTSSRGPHGFPIEALFRLLLAKAILRIDTFTDLAKRLVEDLTFRYACGFDVIKRTPSVATISRFYGKVSSSEAMDNLFNSFVQKLIKENVIHEDVVAIDSSSIESYEHYRKKTHKDDGSMASWGYKKDSKGRPYRWYGYKLHAAVDAKSGLPVAYTVTTANIADSQQAVPIMDRMPFNPKHFCMDKGYDTEEIYYAALDIGSQAIIPLNKRGEKIPPVGMDENHWPICSMGYPLSYWGAEKKRGSVKFRCPHVGGEVDCPQGSFWCASSNYGYVLRLKQKDDSRNVSLPYRGSSAWKKIYKQRGSVERFFGELKEHLNAEKLYVRGINKVTTHLLFCTTALMALNIVKL